MRLLITEVTDMSAGSFCVAGWDIDSHVMIRPLPNGSNWTTATIAQYAVEPGILMEFSPTGRAHNGSFPHTTEDTEVNAANISVIDRSAQNWLGPVPCKRLLAVTLNLEASIEGVCKVCMLVPELDVGPCGGLKFHERTLSSSVTRTKVVLKDLKRLSMMVITGMFFRFRVTL